jgi:hypothetical protein
MRRYVLSVLALCTGGAAVHDRVVSEVLAQLDLLQYRGALERAEIVGSDLPLLWEADLRDAGMPLGPRLRMVHALAQLHGGASAGGAIREPAAAAAPPPLPAEPQPSAGVAELVNVLAEKVRGAQLWVEGKTAQAALVLQRAYGLLHDPELPLLRLAPRARELLREAPSQLAFLEQLLAQRAGVASRLKLRHDLEYLRWAEEGGRRDATRPLLGARAARRAQRLLSGAAARLEGHLAAGEAQGKLMQLDVPVLQALGPEQQLSFGHWDDWPKVVGADLHLAEEAGARLQPGAGGAPAVFPTLGGARGVAGWREVEDAFYAGRLTDRAAVGFEGETAAAAGTAVAGPAAAAAAAAAAVAAPPPSCASQSGFAVVENALSETALRHLRTFLLDSSVWHEPKRGGAYLAAMATEGFASPLLVQIAEELRAAMPRILGEHPLLQAWAFKYDNTESDGSDAGGTAAPGTLVHADLAAVNVNLWITPDEAQADQSAGEDGGGLIVYRQQPPANWDFHAYNAIHDEAKMAELQRWARQNGSADVPYKANRMVLFDSDLLHETAPLRFKKGYKNRRINVTLLFGKACGVQRDDASEQEKPAET